MSGRRGDPDIKSNTHIQRDKLQFPPSNISSSLRNETFMTTFKVIYFFGTSLLMNMSILSSIMNSSVSLMFLKIIPCLPVKEIVPETV